MPALEKRGVRSLASEPARRVNGFGSPLHPLQVVSWVVAAADVSLFAGFCLPLLDGTVTKIVTSIAFVATASLMVGAAAGATYKNPIDKQVLMQDCPPDPVGSTEIDDEVEFCEYCDVPVQSRSKHCRECNKCVDVFDHHCMWLNNCIGKKNYLDFLLAILGVATMVGVMLFSCANLLSDFFNDERLARRMQETPGFESVSQRLILGIIISLLVVNVPLFLLDVQLIFLHIFLTSQHLTTYEYIMVKSGRLSTTEKAKAGVSAAGRLMGRKIMTLPSCLDWIVFARCCKKRRRRAKDATVQPECAQDGLRDPEAGQCLGGASPKATEHQCLGVPVEDPAPVSGALAAEPAVASVVGRPIQDIAKGMPAGTAGALAAVRAQPAAAAAGGASYRASASSPARELSDPALEEEKADVVGELSCADTASGPAELDFESSHSTSAAAPAPLPPPRSPASPPPLVADAPVSRLEPRAMAPVPPLQELCSPRKLEALASPASTREGSEAGPRHKSRNTRGQRSGRSKGRSKRSSEGYRDANASDAPLSAREALGSLAMSPRKSAANASGGLSVEAKAAQIAEDLLQ